MHTLKMPSAARGTARRSELQQAQKKLLIPPDNRRTRHYWSSSFPGGIPQAQKPANQGQCNDKHVHANPADRHPVAPLHFVTSRVEK